MSILPKKHQWVAHNGRKARLRYLRQSCASIINDRSLGIRQALEKLKELVKDEPDPEYGFFHLLFSAQEAARQTHSLIEESIFFMIKAYEEEKTHHTSEIASDPNLK